MPHVSCLTSPVSHLVSQVSRLLSHFSCRRSPDALPVLHLKGQIVKFSDCSKFLVFLFFKYYPRSELLLWLHWSYCVAIVPGAQTVHLFEGYKFLRTVLLNKFCNSSWSLMPFNIIKVEVVGDFGGIKWNHSRENMTIFDEIQWTVCRDEHLKQYRIWRTSKCYWYQFF